MDFLVRLLFVVGFCVAVLGGAGFSAPPEGLAWPLYLGGLAATVAGGAVLRARHRRRRAEGHGGELDLGALTAHMEAILQELRRTEAAAGEWSRDHLVHELDELLVRFAELGNHSEEYFRALGAGVFSRIWDGFAAAERLTARARSMAADGFLDDARAELPRAAAQLERAVQAARSETRHA